MLLRIQSSREATRDVSGVTRYNGEEGGIWGTVRGEEEGEKGLRHILAIVSIR